MDILKVFSTDDQFQKRQTAIFQTILTSIGEKWRLIYSVRFLKDKQQNTTISGKIHLLPSKETLARKEQTLTETDIFHKIRVIFLNDYCVLPHCHLVCRVSFFLVLAKNHFWEVFLHLEKFKVPWFEKLFLNLQHQKCLWRWWFMCWIRVFAWPNWRLL